MDVWEGIPGAKESKRKKGTAWIGTNRVGSAPLVEEDRARQEEGATASERKLPRSKEQHASKQPSKHTAKERHEGKVKSGRGLVLGSQKSSMPFPLSRSLPNEDLALKKIGPRPRAATPPPQS